MGNMHGLTVPHNQVHHNSAANALELTPIQDLVPANSNREKFLAPNKEVNDADSAFIQGQLEACAIEISFHPYFCSAGLLKKTEEKREERKKVFDLQLVHLLACSSRSRLLRRDWTPTIDATSRTIWNGKLGPVRLRGRGGSRQRRSRRSQSGSRKTRDDAHAAFDVRGLAILQNSVTKNADPRLDCASEMGCGSSTLQDVPPKTAETGRSKVSEAGKIYGIHKPFFPC